MDDKNNDSFLDLSDGSGMIGTKQRGIGWGSDGSMTWYGLNKREAKELVRAFKNLFRNTTKI